MKNKFLSLLVVLGLLFSLSACTQKQPPAAQQEGKTVLRVVFPRDRRTDAPDNSLITYLEEQTGCVIEAIYVSGASNGQSVLTELLDSEEQPDIILSVHLSADEVTQFGQDRKLLDLQKYYADKDGASKEFWNRMESDFSPYEQEDVLRMITEPQNGAIYCVPLVEKCLDGAMDYETWINTQWMQALGMDNPTNLDELYAVLKAFNEAYPDCIPLYGCNSRNAVVGADVVSWLINNFMYFDDRKPFHVDQDGTLSPAFTQDKYREAVQFIRKLYDEELLHFSSETAEIKHVITPEDGQLKCGIFVGNLTVHTQRENEAFYAYKCLPPLDGQSCIHNAPYIWRSGFINATTKHPDEAFRLMMALWTDEGVIRANFGEKDLYWTQADPGSTTEYGFPAKAKTTDLYNLHQSTASGAHALRAASVLYDPRLLAQSENELAEVEQYKIQQIVESRALYDAAAKENNPEVVCPVLRYTPDSLELRTAVNDYFKTATDEFILGTRDPNSNEDWNQYLSDLEELGLAEYVALAQEAHK